MDWRCLSASSWMPDVKRRVAKAGQIEGECRAGVERIHGGKARPYRNHCRGGVKFAIKMRFFCEVTLSTRARYG